MEGGKETSIFMNIRMGNGEGRYRGKTVVW